MRVAVCLVGAALTSACATSAVVSTGKDSYMVSASRCGICEPVQVAVTRLAGQYCAGLGKNLLVGGLSGNFVQPMFPASATLTFRCLASDDPAYKAAILRPDRGVTTIQTQSLPPPQ